MGKKDWFVDSGILVQGSADQNFKRMHYLQSIRLHKDAF